MYPYDSQGPCLLRAVDKKLKRKTHFSPYCHKTFQNDYLPQVQIAKKILFSFSTSPLSLFMKAFIVKIEK